MNEVKINDVIVDLMVEKVKERMNCDVIAMDVPKNNGMKKAIAIREKGVRIVPTIYIDDMISEIVDHKLTVESAVEEIIDVYIKNKEPEGIADIVSRLSKETILQDVQYQLVNKEQNKARLEEVPYKEFLDLAALYRTILQRTEEGNAGIVINNKLCEVYGISQEELEAAAKRNMEKETFKVASMAEVLGFAGIPIEDEVQMYVCSNKSGINGATIMFETKYFRELAEKLESDLYILPSSISEVIAIPISAGDLESLKEMVKSINGTEVAAEEVLSDTVYKYIREEDKIIIA